jgi:hypothetical protein
MDFVKKCTFFGGPVRKPTGFLNKSNNKITTQPGQFRNHGFWNRLAFTGKTEMPARGSSGFRQTMGNRTEGYDAIIRLGAFYRDIFKNMRGG